MSTFLPSAPLLSRIPRLVVLDFETTMSPTGQRPVEIACLVVERGVATAALVELIQPRCRIDPWTQAVHGISDSMVRDAPPFEALWPRVEPVLAGAVVVAHYAPFDAGVLAGELARLRLAAPAVDWWCTCRLSRRLWPKRYPNYKLGTLAEALRLPGNATHRAGSDAAVTLELLRVALDAAPEAGYPTLKALHPLARHRGKSWPHPPLPPIVETAGCEG